MDKIYKVASVIALCFAIAFTGCNTDKGSTTELFSKLCNTGNLQSQFFTIDNNETHAITGAGKTTLYIDKNSFIDADGKPVTGTVDIELIEAYAPIDRVLGNLTTTFEDKPLETGGMIYISAKAGGKQLALAVNKEIAVNMPADPGMKGMSLFEGEKDSIGIKWRNPVPVNFGRWENEEKQVGKITMPAESAKALLDSGNAQFTEPAPTTNVNYFVDGFETGNEPAEVTQEVSRMCWQGAGLKISKDSVFKYKQYTIHFIKQAKLLTLDDFWNGQEDKMDLNKLVTKGSVQKPVKGTNSFDADMNTTYVFSVKKLGWANIDRLIDDPRTKEVALVTEVHNNKDFGLVYISMITKKMYLPGYQKKDNTYSFSHGDAETQKLPVGENATIIATAYKNDKPYIAIQKITIAEKQTLTLNLHETTIAELKEELKKQI